MVTERMTAAFQKAEGGTFSSVEKADVGDAVEKMRERGVSLMSGRSVLSGSFYAEACCGSDDRIH